MNRRSLSSSQNIAYQFMSHFGPRVQSHFKDKHDKSPSADHYSLGHYQTFSIQNKLHINLILLPCKFVVIGKKVEIL